MITLDLTDHNLWHFMNEIMLPTWHSLLNVDLIPAHVKRRVATPSACTLVTIPAAHSLQCVVLVPSCHYCACVCSQALQAHCRF